MLLPGDLIEVLRSPLSSDDLITQGLFLPGGFEGSLRGAGSRAVRVRFDWPWCSWFSRRPCRRGTAGRTHPQPETCYGCFLPDLTGFTGPRTRADPAIPPRHVHRQLNCGRSWGQSIGQDDVCRVIRNRPACGGALAERVGFEPTEWQAIHLISNQARSTGLRHLSGRRILAPIGSSVPRLSGSPESGDGSGGRVRPFRRSPRPGLRASLLRASRMEAHSGCPPR